MGLEQAMVPILDTDNCVIGWALRTTSAAPVPRTGQAATTTTTTNPAPPAAAPPPEDKTQALIDAMDRLIAALKETGF